MEEMGSSNSSNKKNNLIDLIKHIKLIWKNRKTLIKIVSLFFIFGCIVALTSPVVYKAQTIFVPQTSDEKVSSNGLNSLASLAGIDLNAQKASSIDNYISPLLYSKIIESDEFSYNLINEKIIFEDGKEITIKEYIEEKNSNFNPINLFRKTINFFKKYTFDLIFEPTNNELKDSEITNDYNFISVRNHNIITIFRKKFSIEPNKKQGYIQVNAVDKNPFISAQLVNLVTKTLQSEIISLRTNKISEQLEYSKEQYLNKKLEFEILQKKLAKFRDSNKNISTAIFLAELEKLETEYQLQKNILLSLASEYNNNKIKLNKDTPIFSVLDEVSIPNQRFKPDRKLIVLLYLFNGLIISIGYIYLKEPIKRVINTISKS